VSYRFRRAFWLVCLGGLALLQGSCTALMMSGGGGYDPPDETCSDERRRAGQCQP
jgi:hypothetical protein